MPYNLFTTCRMKLRNTGHRYPGLLVLRRAARRFPGFTPVMFLNLV